MSDRPARVPRLFVEAELRAGGKVALPAAAAHHAARVLRLRAGDPVTLFDGRGGEFAARITLPGKGAVVAEVGAKRDIERESPLAVTLAQGISSGEKMDFTIQKAIELGVAAIQPLLAGRSVVRLSGERAARRLAHWRRIAIAACEQCGRNRIPEVREPLPLERYRPEAAATRLLLSPFAEKGLRELAGDSVILAVGPEAGFTAEEEAQLERAGFVRAGLGPRVLRTETAALAALAALNALRGDF
jgi:16S rRNA (uracil1498-N3)-methyltransferase